jgi:L-glutamine-phosphate cytidylyltransferase
MSADKREGSEQVPPRVIIVAAGQGSRLAHYTVDRPKCMLPFGSKTLLQHQLAAFVAHGLDDFHVVRGYQGDKITYSGITYHANSDFSKNNILNSLFCAEPALSGSIIVSYADILIEPRIVGELLNAEHDISVVVDTDWREYYVGRSLHPVDEAEIVVLSGEQRVSQIGKIMREAPSADGEFIGMMKLSARGTELLKSEFHSARAEHLAKPFQRAATFEKAYLTDLLQYMISRGVDIHAVPISQGWKEIDTVEDYEKALQSFPGGSKI